MKWPWRTRDGVVSVRALPARPGWVCCGAVVLGALAPTLPALAQSPKEFWVGNIGSPVTQYQYNTYLTPFPTMQDALREVRAWMAATAPLGEDVIVHVAGGQYFVDEPLVFTLDDSGTASYSVTWQAWSGSPHQSDSDPLVTGGVKVTAGWTSVGTTSDGGTKWYTDEVPNNVPAIRDLWYQGKRLVRARFPNVPDGCDLGGWGNPTSSTPPCANEGFLLVDDVDRDDVADEQVVTIVIPGGSGYEIPDLADWEGVELVGLTGYVSPRQIIQDDEQVLWSDVDEVRFTFPVTKWANPSASPTIPDGGQDLGGFGVLDLEEDPTFSWQHVSVAGPGDSSPPYPKPTQVILENHEDFVDATFEWHYDPETREMWVVLPCNSSPASDTPGVVAPVAEQLLILDRASFIEFNGIDFGYTHFPFPTMADGATPGYATVQSSWQWQDNMVNWSTYNTLPGAVVLQGAENCRLELCRIGHTGASGVTVGTYTNPFANSPNFQESNTNVFYRLEVFDTGGHGVYMGDNLAQAPDSWEATQDISRPDPHENNHFVESYIHRYGLIYKDAAGLFISHTRGTEVRECKVELGNWSGMALGTIQRHMYDGDAPGSPGTFCCTYQGGTILWPQTNEDTVLQGNYIHKACLRMNDGGGIYMMGSHLNSLMDANFVSRVDFNPYRNFNHVVPGLYWDGGSDGWTITNNYVVDCHYPFRFAASVAATATAPSTCNWGQSAWPIPWMPTCYPTGFTGWPGQTWDDDYPNWWFEPANPLSGPWTGVQQCPGYPVMDFGDYPTGTPENFEIDVRGEGGSAAIENAAGPTNVGSWFPYSGERIYPAAYPCELDEELELLEWYW